MGEKGTKSVGNVAEEDFDLTARQIKVFDARLGGKKRERLSVIAKNLGVCTRTIEREEKAIKESDWIQRQINRIQDDELLMYANWRANVEFGNLDAVLKVWRGTGVLKEKLEVSGSIEQTLTDEELTGKAKEVIAEVVREMIQAKGKVEGAKRIEATVVLNPTAKHPETKTHRPPDR